MGSLAVHEETGAVRMSKTNCVNCGAAKEINEIKCPFCGTTYLDLTAIDFSSNAPVVCEFVMPYGKQVVQMFAIPRLEEITCEPVYYGLHDGFRFSTYCDSVSVNFGVSFQPIAQKNGALLTIRNEKP